MSSSFAEELDQARQTGPEAMQALAEKHLPLVSAMVRRFSMSGMPREDLYQQGVVGLMKALSRFDPAKGTAFSTYAIPLILGEMRQLQRQESLLHIPRTEVVLRRQLRQRAETLRNALQREPTICELAESLHMEAAELMLHMDDLTVASSDAPVSTGKPLGELLPDPTDMEQRIELRDLLARLPPQDQQLVLLRHRMGLTQAQAGCRLGMTQMQVSRREQTIRRVLRAAMQE